MAFVKSRTSETRTAPATSERKGPAVLGYLNIGINTAKPGDVRRIESIRLLDNNPLHVVIYEGLNACREDDPTFEVEGLDAKAIAKLEEQRKALLAERLASFASKLNISFNPSRTDADSELVKF